MQHKKLAISVAIVVAGMSHAPVYATNGMLLTGYGFRSQAMGGVGVAYGRDSLSVAANPANAVNTGMRGDMGFGIFNAERHAAVGSDAGENGPFNFYGSVESDNKYFIMPEMGFTMSLTERLSVGMAFVPNGGGNTTYRENFFSYRPSLVAPEAYPIRGETLGVDLMQLLAPLTIAYKVNEDHAVGASLNFAVQRFRAYGLQAFLQFGGSTGPLNGKLLSDPAHLTNLGFDYSYGAGVRLGWLGEFMDDKLTVGLTYASKTYMTKFDLYRGLFPEQGDMDIPENYGIGIAIKPAKGLVVAADITRINYADVASIGNRGPGTGVGTGGVPSSSDPTTLLGMDQGMGFGWTNQTVYKLGVNYGLNERWQIRAGYNYGKSPIPDDQLAFNTLAPATTEHHYSAGFTYKPNDTLEVTGTYVYAAPNSQKSLGQNILGGVEIDMHQHLFALSLGWVLDPGVTDYGDSPSDPIDFGSGDKGYYAGFSFGQAKLNDWSSDIFIEELKAMAPGFYTNSRNRGGDDKSEGWKVFAGYQFNKYLALEGGFNDLGDARARYLVRGPAPVGTTISGTTLETYAENDAWTLAAVGLLPLTDSFSAFAKLGFSSWSSNLRTTQQLNQTLVTTPDLTGERGDSGVDPYYGLGVSYALFDNLAFRGEWERFENVGGLDVNLYTAGFAVKF